MKDVHIFFFFLSVYLELASRTSKNYRSPHVGPREPIPLLYLHSSPLSLFRAGHFPTLLPFSLFSSLPLSFHFSYSLPHIFLRIPFFLPPLSTPSLSISLSFSPPLCLTRCTLHTHYITCMAAYHFLKQETWPFI